MPLICEGNKYIQCVHFHPPNFGYVVFFVVYTDVSAVNSFLTKRSSYVYMAHLGVAWPKRYRDVYHRQRHVYTTHRPSPCMPELRASSDAYPARAFASLTARKVKPSREASYPHILNPLAYSPS